jgi:hypothetical protein
MAAVCALSAISSGYTVFAQSGSILISQFRPRGPETSNPNSSNNQFVELYNNTGAPINVQGWTIRTINSSTLTTIATLPNVSIPAGAHYLVTGSKYSLGSYPGGGTDSTPSGTSGNATLSGDIPDDGGVAVYDNAGTPVKIDSVGFTGSSNALVEGTGLAGVLNNTSSQFTSGQEYAYVRRIPVATGTPVDTDNNANDFVFVAPDAGTYGPAGSPVHSTLGSAAPRNLASPVILNGLVVSSLIDPNVGATNAPNRERVLCPSPGTCGATQPLGTLIVRRRFTNLTGQTLTRLRFHVIDLTTTSDQGTPAGTADLRLLSSSDTTVQSFNVKGTTLETPTNASFGGGLNSTLRLTTTNILPLAPGQSVDVQFVLGVAQGGNFRFFINIEGLTQ